MLIQSSSITVPILFKYNTIPQCNAFNHLFTVQKINYTFSPHLKRHLTQSWIKHAKQTYLFQTSAELDMQHSENKKK